jgi:demethylmenaquinone methyltransferase/2-methoxy-6-polyprenyl-1,4-benzoquinol methylase
MAPTSGRWCRALAPSGRALFVDDNPGEKQALNEAVVADAAIPSVERTLHDGSHHRVVKVWYEPDELIELLGEHGWETTIWPLNDIRFAGSAQPRGC